MTFFQLPQVIFAISAISASLAFPGKSDVITQLPGLNAKINFKQYSGYLDATGNVKLHYWLVESERSPKDDPVVLWMNGGPGCSSLGGLFLENGPFQVNSSDPRKLVINEYRWNRMANVLYLESPAGVGFSYIEGSKNYATNDDETAKNHYAAVRSFFKKFSQFKNNRFFLTGESYAGVYVPMLATFIKRNSPDINLIGFAIGNGAFDRQMVEDSHYVFAYYHGLTGREKWNNLINRCCSDGKDLKSCRFYHNDDKSCQEARGKVEEDWVGINKYNIYKDCDFENVHSHYPPCLNGRDVAKYLNGKSVKESLHIPDVVGAWRICREPFFKETYKKQHRTMKPFILELLKSGKRGLIYSGDIDMRVNFIGTQWFMEDLQLPAMSDYKQWKMPNSSRVSGYIKIYSNLTYATIRGAGHKVPQDKPEEFFFLMDRFLRGEVNHLCDNRY